jgi:phosphomannomutase
MGDNLTPIDIVKFVTGYALWLRKNSADNHRLKVVVGRDARLSGEMVAGIVIGTLMGCGVDVIDTGLCTTPGTELAVTHYRADGGIIITASHNPKQWNALKLLGSAGEFLTEREGNRVLELSEFVTSEFAEIDNIGHIVLREDFNPHHIDMVLALPQVDVRAVRAKKYRVVVDAVNSVGGIVIPQLLERLGCEVICLNCEPNGEFAHNPEPIAENLTEICKIVQSKRADLGIVIDPDVDRLALVSETGELFGEEYTLVAVADYILGHCKIDSQYSKNAVSNLSSSRALRDVTEKYGGTYSAAAVGEVNVVAKMKETDAIIGGEGNGGVIFPALHYGRDALVGVALFLTYLTKLGVTMSELRAQLPQYFMAKRKLEIGNKNVAVKIFSSLKERYCDEKITCIDGVKIDFTDSWAHIRGSNTEPIMRVYTEAHTQKEADELAERMIEEVSHFVI